MSENTGSAKLVGDGVEPAPEAAPEPATQFDVIPIPGTDATLTVDLGALADANAGLALPDVAQDFPDLVPHSGENFGKPSLSGS